MERHELFPVTCLSSLARGDKNRLLENDLVLLRDLRERPEALRQLGNAAWVARVLGEIDESVPRHAPSRSRR